MSERCDAFLLTQQLFCTNRKSLTRAHGHQAWLWNRGIDGAPNY